jgi:hypothetical protein
MLRFRRMITALCLMTVGGCFETTAPDHGIGAARTRWAANGTPSYDITVSRSCECTAEMAAPVIVSVRNGSVQSRTYVASGAAVSPTFADLFPTVEGLFSIIDDAIEQRAAMLSVRYDPTYGYPVSISIDFNAVGADDEIVYTITNFANRG